MSGRIEEKPTMVKDETEQPDQETDKLLSEQDSSPKFNSGCCGFRHRSRPNWLLICFSSISFLLNVLLVLWVVLAAQERDHSPYSRYPTQSIKKKKIKENTTTEK
jgi:hypothetical protein